MNNLENMEIDTEKEILLVDKPAGVSSFFCVGKIRREICKKLGVKKYKVGHAGTLDPFATGLLIILTGKGTKRASEFLKLDKEYIAKIRLGETSTTGDIEGEIIKHETCNEPSFEEIANVVKCFVGEIEQRVPEYSAVKIKGKRAYKLAREGKKVEMPVRKVKIYDIEIIKYEWPELTIKCEVSSGTYIRQLGMDIGEKLGTGGYLTELRRTKIGEYKIEDAIKMKGKIEEN